MKIRLEKEEKLNGDIWYKVYAGTECECIKDDGKTNESGVSLAEMNAQAIYFSWLSRQKDGFPKTTILLSEEIVTDKDRDNVNALARKGLAKKINQ